MTLQSSEFYLRQASVSGIGRQGLAKLGTSTVAVAGAGGVGSSAAYYLAKSGLGSIRLIDQDIIEPSNLQRIHSATKADLFHPKAEVLSRRLSGYDSSTRVEAVVDTITNRNVDRLLEGADIVLDGLDNFRTRYVINRFAVRNKTPYLFTSAVAEQAHFALVHPPSTPCLECIIPHVSDRFEDSCENLGVNHTTTGLAGAIAASTAIQFLLGGRTRLTDAMLTLDMVGPEFLFSRLSRTEGCTACSSPANHDEISKSSVTLLCGEHTANILPPRAMDLRLSRASSTIPVETILARSDSVLVYRQGPYTISLFRNGRLLISGISEEALASRIANEIWGSVEESRMVDES